MAPDKSTTNILTQLISKIYGNQGQTKLDKIDAILSRSADKIADKNIHNQIEMMRTVISTAVNNEILSSVDAGVYFNSEIADRLNRYLNSDEIIDCIPYCSRALMLLANGILSPDDITKQSIDVLSEQPEPDKDFDIKELKQIIKRLSIHRVVKSSVKECLKYGDDFLEICDYESEDIPVTQSLLTEGSDEINDDFVINWAERNPYNNNETKFNINVEYEIVQDNTRDFDLCEDDDDDKKKNDGTVPLENIRILQHTARNIIKLQTRKNRLCLGYLVLPTVGASGINSASPNSNDKSNVSSTRSMSPNALNTFLPDYTAMAGVDSLYISIFKRIKKMIGDKDLIIDNKATKKLLARVIRDMGLNDELDERGKLRLQLRFVPESRMVHWYVENNRYYPYGESIFNNIIFQAKLLIALETAATIKRLSESTEKRIIKYDPGRSRDNNRNVLGDIQREMKRLSYSIDTFGTIASIPSMLQTYQTFYIPEVNGKSYINFDTLPPSPDLRSVVEDLKYHRDALVAALHVPAPYLSLEENMSNKNSLSFENAIFADTIVSYQYALGPCLKELINKIYRITKQKDIPEHITINFPAPKMLQIERESERMQYISNILQAMKEMNVPIDWSKKKYLDLPWEDIENSRIKGELDDMEGKNTEEDKQNLGNFGTSGY